MVLGLAERFGQAPHDVLSWDMSVLQMLAIEALGREEERAHGGIE